MAYLPVSIANSTSYNASGTVTYPSAFCSNDNYSVTPGTVWTASGRGVCLLTEITATLNTPNGQITATPYTSSGTSYSQFAIINTGGNNYAVTRQVTGVEDEPPEDYAEPKTKQK